MDVRDFEFWFRASKKKLLVDHKLRIQASRLMQAKDSAYLEFMNELQKEIRRIDIGEQEAIREDWEMLKAKGKG